MEYIQADAGGLIFLIMIILFVFLLAIAPWGK